MARLTDRELDLIQQARRSPSWRTRDDEADRILLKARCERSRVMAHLIRQGVIALARVTGIAATARFLADRVVLPMRRHALRRRTVNELVRLEDHLLDDIGIARDEVGRLATDLALTALPDRRPRAGLLARLASWFRRRAAIRELEALDDRMLADIGLLRGNIREAVEGAAAGEGAGAAPTLEQANYWDAVTRVLQQRDVSREAARDIVRNDPDAAITLGKAEGDFDWVPAGVAGQRPDRHQAA